MLDKRRCAPTFLRQPAMAQLVLASIEFGVTNRCAYFPITSLTLNVSLSKLLGSLKGSTAKRANLTH